MNRALSFVLAVVCCFGLCLCCYSGTLEEQRKSATAQLKASLKGALVSADAAELSAAIDAYVDGKINNISNTIDKHVKGDAARASLKNAIEQIRNGDISKVNVGKVARDVSVGAIKDAVTRNLGEKEARAVNQAIDAYVADGARGVKDAAQAAAQNAVDKAIDRHVKGDEAKAALRDAVEKIVTGNAEKIDVGKVAQDVTVGALKNAVSKLGGEGAAALNDAIDGLVKGGVAGAKDSVQQTVNGLIDKYVKGDEAKNSLKETVGLLKDGDIGKIDVEKVAKDVALGGINDWIDRQGWSEQTRKDAKSALGAFFENGVDGLTETGANILQARLADKIGAENAQNLFGQISKIVEQGSIGMADIGALGNLGLTIFRNKLTGIIDAQLGKLAQKYPILGKLFGIVDFNGEKIVDTIRKVGGILFSSGSVAEKLSQLSGLAMEELNAAMEKLGKFVTEKLTELLQQFSKIAKALVDKVLNWIKSKGEKIKEVIKKVKDFIGKLKKTLEQIKETGKYILEKADDLKVTVKDSINRVKDNAQKVVREVYKEATTPASTR